MTATRAIAVVIPTLDEADRVGAAVESAVGGSLRPAASGSPPSGRSPCTVEVLVVDGGSQDGTTDVARSRGARVLDSSPGRGRQLDVGWRATTAPVVVFLHADTVLPAGWCEAVTSALDDEAVAGGAFRFGLHERGLSWRVLEWGVALRVSLFGLPYGDQALFVRRGVLETCGGVPDVPILEDLDLVRAIKGAGTLRVVAATARTSARRHRGGFTSTVSRHALALAGYYLGLDRRWLARRVRP